MSAPAAGPWYVVNAGAIRPAIVDGYPTSAVAVSSHGCARAVALVYAGFGDGPETAALIAAAPAMRDALLHARAVFEGVARSVPDGTTFRAISAELELIRAALEGVPS